MKKFISKVVLFLIPVFLFFIPPGLVLWLSRENYYDLDDIIASDKKHLIGYAYNENNYRYIKWKSLQAKYDPEILALGSSRVLQFRKEMFQSPFYNAGFAVSGIDDFLPFIKSIPDEKMPGFLILGLDQWMFNPNWDNFKFGNNPDETKWSRAFTRSPGIDVILNVWNDILHGKYKYKTFLSPDKSILKIGLNAVINGKGFRNDGSIYYGKMIRDVLQSDSTLVDYQFRDTYFKIEKGMGRFKFSSVINQDGIKELDQLLRFCHNKKIKVIGVLPPYAGSVYKELSMTGKHAFITRLPGELTPVFDKYHFQLFDFTDPEIISSSDTEFVDGFHGSEVTYLRMLIYMSQHNVHLKKLTSLTNMQTSLNNRFNSLEVYD